MNTMGLMPSGWVDALNSGLKKIPDVAHKSADASFAQAATLKGEAVGAKAPVRENKKDPKRLLVAVLAAFGSKMLDKSGSMGAQLLHSFMQSEQQAEDQSFQERQQAFESEQRAKLVQSESAEATGARMEGRANRYDDAMQRKAIAGQKSDTARYMADLKDDTNKSNLVTTLMNQVNGAKNRFAAEGAYKRLQVMAADDLNIAAALPDRNTFNQSLDGMGHADRQKLVAEYKGSLDAFGVVPDDQKAYLENRRKEIADNWFGGDLAQVPPVPTLATMRSQQFEQSKLEFGARLKHLEAERRDKLAKMASDLRIDQARLEVSMGQLGVSRENTQIRRQELLLARSAKGVRTEFEKEIGKLAQEKAKWDRIQNTPGASYSDERAKAKLEAEGIQAQIDFLRSEQQAASGGQVAGTSSASGGAAAGAAAGVDNRTVGNTGLTRSQVLSQAQAQIAAYPNDSSVKNTVNARLKGLGLPTIP